MNSSFMGLEINKRGLMAHQQALHTTGHNISNAENKEYSRQRVVITANEPIYNPSLNRAETAGQMGQGSVVERVERVRDSFIDDRIVVEKNVEGFWKARDNFVYQVEHAYNEPSDQSLRTKLDELWRGWEELSKYPEQRSTRAVVKEKAVALTSEIQNVYRQLQDLRNDANRQVEERVNQINNYAHDVRDLNERIMKSQAVGDNPNDLLDKRDALIEKMSSLVNVSVGRSDKDEVIVYIGGENLVQGEVVHPLKAEYDAQNEGYFNVVWAQSGAPVKLEGGELASLVDVRDNLIRNNINSVNAFAVNLVDLTNEIHRDGFGRAGQTNVNFFRELSISDNTEGNYDINNDGQHDVSAIFKISGANKVDASAAIGMTGTLSFVTNDKHEAAVQIDYSATDTVNTVIKKINDAKLGVVAYMDHNGQLAVKATLAKDDDRRNFMVRHLEDSGQFLVGLTGILRQSGAQGSFDYRRLDDIAKINAPREHITITPKQNSASYIAVSDEIVRDVDRIAAAKGKDIGGTGDYNTSNGAGDGTNALRMAELRYKNAMVDSASSFNDYYVSIISKIGAQGEEAKDRVQGQETLLKNLTNMRESVSGVNLDEEMASMVAFQHGYNANARMISTFDKMYETIIRLGQG